LETEKNVAFDASYLYVLQLAELLLIEEMSKSIDFIL